MSHLYNPALCPSCLAKYYDLTFDHSKNFTSFFSDTFLKMDSKSSEGEPENLPDAQDLFADLEKQSLGSSTKSVNLLHQKKTLNPRD